MLMPILLRCHLSHILWYINPDSVIIHKAHLSHQGSSEILDLDLQWDPLFNL